jgi:integrase/recombinase XerD
MRARSLAAAGLTMPVAVEFLDGRRGQGQRKMIPPRALTPLLKYLHGLRVVPDPSRRYAVTPIDTVLEEYRRFLENERGLAPGTVYKYMRLSRIFIADVASPGGTVVRDLTSGQITGFMLRYSVGCNPWSAKGMVVALRSLLGFLHVGAHVSTSLVAAVPSVPSRSQTTLPRGLDTMKVTALLDTCDRDTAKGRRDYAILVVLARLGLRSVEVARLRLDDIDWHLGELVICGKRNHVERMPLPTDVGQALADYVEHGRPRSPSRAVFLIGRAPWTGLTAMGVREAVAIAGKRAGLDGRVGTHRLRHAVACDLLRRGSALTEVAQLLRHRDLRTTAIYAKVDQDALGALAQPWPGGIS